MFIPDRYQFLSILDPGFRISDPQQQQKRGKIFCHKFYKTEIFFNFEQVQTQIWANLQRIIVFLPNIFSLCSEIWVSDQGFEKNLSRITDPGVKNPSDSGSWIRICNTEKLKLNLDDLW